ncbi:hypothetical protein M407DRAFT_9265 [Tulasnella calospora MUT 4182]|uniref:Uncharacterized protein n=1 Tax=Tulasnella calospora MUT 4182 TaxID=1051891 RepID=A0A0C3LQU9_9AGAM|nr:hypothetical protein M407DRAFT_9265 [Tulasnella calospora MUT 4182]
MTRAPVLCLCSVGLFWTPVYHVFKVTGGVKAGAVLAKAAFVGERCSRPAEGCNWASRAVVISLEPHDGHWPGYSSTLVEGVKGRHAHAMSDAEQLGERNGSIAMVKFELRRTTGPPTSHSCSTWQPPSGSVLIGIETITVSGDTSIPNGHDYCIFSRALTEAVLSFAHRDKTVAQVLPTSLLHRDGIPSLNQSLRFTTQEEEPPAERESVENTRQLQEWSLGRKPTWFHGLIDDCRPLEEWEIVAGEGNDRLDINNCQAFGSSSPEINSFSRLAPNCGTIDRKRIAIGRQSTSVTQVSTQVHRSIACAKYFPPFLPIPVLSQPL